MCSKPLHRKENSVSISDDMMEVKIWVIEKIINISKPDRYYWAKKFQSSCWSYKESLWHGSW